MIEKTNITIELNTGIDLTEATVTNILYESPSGVKGVFAATKSGRVISAKMQLTSLAETGTWKFQAYVEFGGDRFKGTITPVLITESLLA